LLYLTKNLKIYWVYTCFGAKPLAKIENLNSHDRLRAATESDDMFAWEIDFIQDKMVWSPNAARILRCTQDQLSDNPAQSFFYLTDLDRIRIVQEFELAKRGQRNDYSLEFSGFDPDQSKSCWDMRGKFDRDSNGSAELAYGTTKNVTERKKLELELKLATERLAIAEVAADGLIYDWDITTNKMWRSPGFTRLLGWHAEEISNDIEGWTSLRHPEDEERLKFLQSSFDLQSNDHYILEYRVRHRDGHYISVIDSGRAHRNEAGQIIRFAGITRDNSEHRLADSYNARLAAVAMASHDALFGLTLEGIIETWNPAAERLFGYSASEAIGKDVNILARPDQKEHQQQLLARALSSDVVTPYEARRQRKDGTLVDIVVALAPVRAADGTVTSISVAIHDISERKEWAQRQLSMARELAHRNKNSFAILQGILRSTLRNTKNPEDFATSFSSRLHSLAAAQDVLTANEWRGTELGALIRLQLAAHLFVDDKRVEFSGPVISLAPEYASPLGLIFNELTTNAIKYGALSLPNGTVKITWRVEKLDQTPSKLFIIWQERGGPEITSKVIVGFGTTIIEKGLPEAVVKNDFAEEGLTCSIELALNPPNA
jgi:PAS domain S-box-containing protein